DATISQAPHAVFLPSHYSNRESLESLKCPPGYGDKCFIVETRLSKSLRLSPSLLSRASSCSRL
ncbi:hypothetical protein, partial [Infirmifilum sp.]|uniref:hypothetical protein n=1 Tax=Infirmifilum sp. TaxID=2856575 RepID=UPI003D09CB26